MLPGRTPHCSILSDETLPKRDGVAGKTGNGHAGPPHESATVMPVCHTPDQFGMRRARTGWPSVFAFQQLAPSR